MCFRPHELSGVLLPEPRPTPQRENPAEIARSSLGRGDSITGARLSVQLLLSSLGSASKNTNTRSHAARFGAKWTAGRH